MSAEPQIMEITSSVRRKLVDKVQRQSEVISFEDDPALASLCTALGLQFELGRIDYDRMSPFFGVEPSSDGNNPWISEIISRDSKVGLRFRPKDGRKLEIRHPDFRYIIDPSSFDDKGELSHIVIFPGDIAATYKAKGFQLVIVRDWILTSSLNLDERTQVPYLYANQWEIENNIAATQVRLMVKNQLAFSGTHDVVDHLLGAHSSRFNVFRDLFQQVFKTYEVVFPQGQSRSWNVLVHSYLIGVLLDDLAQPKWYGSKNHEALLRMALMNIRGNQPPASDSKRAEFPPSFHALVDCLRSKNCEAKLLSQRYSSFLSGN
jgi:hypothetical protein